MKFLKFLLLGVVFGILMVKSEAVSWFRIQEMFRFQSFHMYGIIGVAVVGGVLVHLIIKRLNIKDFQGNPIIIPNKALLWKANLFGGILFGFGWALTGACPGPLYTLLGAGYGVFIAIILAAMLGTFTYGVLKPRLPH